MITKLNSFSDECIPLTVILLSITLCILGVWYFFYTPTRERLIKREGFFKRAVRRVKNVGKKIGSSIKKGVQRGENEVNNLTNKIKNVNKDVLRGVRESDKLYYKTVPIRKKVLKPITEMGNSINREIQRLRTNIVKGLKFPVDTFLKKVDSIIGPRAAKKALEGMRNERNTHSIRKSSNRFDVRTNIRQRGRIRLPPRSRR